MRPASSASRDKANDVFALPEKQDLAWRPLAMEVNAAESPNSSDVAVETRRPPRGAEHGHGCTPARNNATTKLSLGIENNFANKSEKSNKKTRGVRLLTTGKEIATAVMSSLPPLSPMAFKKQAVGTGPLDGAASVRGLGEEEEEEKWAGWDGEDDEEGYGEDVKILWARNESQYKQQSHRCAEDSSLGGPVPDRPFRTDVQVSVVGRLRPKTNKIVFLVL